MLQGWGTSGQRVGLLFPRGWAVLSFPEREKLEGCFWQQPFKLGGS